MLNTHEVAKLYGVEYRSVLYAVSQKKLKAKKYGWVWLFDEKKLPKEWPIREKRKKGVS